MANYRIKRYFSTRRIAYLAVLVALSVVLNMVSVHLGSYAVSFTYIPCFIAGIFLGPVSGLLVGLLGDVLGCLIAPKGAWIPLLTLGSTLLGLIPGLIFRIKKVHPMVLLGLSFAATFLVCTCGVNTFGLWLLYSKGRTFFVYLGVRLPLQGVIVAINVVIMYALYYPLARFVFREPKPKTPLENGTQAAQSK